MNTCGTCKFFEMMPNDPNARGACHSEPPRVMPMPVPVVQGDAQHKHSRLALPKDQDMVMQVLPTSNRPIVLDSDLACRHWEATS